MARTPLSDEDLLAISLRCAELMHEHDGDAPTKALVEASGFSERTFFRYFPTKAESLRPLFNHGNRRFAAALARRTASSTVTIVDAVADAFSEAFAEDGLVWGRHLMQLVLSSPPLRRVWLETNDDLAELLVPTLAQALGLAHDDGETSLAADQAVLLAVSALRRMALLDEGPQDAAAHVADAFRGAPLLRTAQSSTHQHTNNS
ncbi:TetR family transcriptional regulator [Lysinibacter cavernae]|uniref:AcrR family transcriptional regulator n=1 Tax=Lysinibacter cavernae TaxID=1640652 RepID=A0A7X5R0A3_9MICO|nr:TetR family transcriptional regulator [Lysinibacter cavernae]NIH53254.1 AcrR family transcriptional regulator [Lysinibacter cavernae]